MTEEQPKLEQFVEKSIKRLENLEVNEDGSPKYEKLSTGPFLLIMGGLLVLGIGALLYALFV